MTGVPAGGDGLVIVQYARIIVDGSE
jgi:hypothetical protein